MESVEAEMKLREVKEKLVGLQWAEAWFLESNVARSRSKCVGVSGNSSVRPAVWEWQCVRARGVSLR